MITGGKQFAYFPLSKIAGPRTRFTEFPDLARFYPVTSRAIPEESALVAAGLVSREGVWIRHGEFRLEILASRNQAYPPIANNLPAGSGAAFGGSANACSIRAATPQVRFLPAAK
jgi:hypothetical protein